MVNPVATPHGGYAEVADLPVQQDEKRQWLFDGTGDCFVEATISAELLFFLELRVKGVCSNSGSWLRRQPSAIQTVAATPALPAINACSMSRPGLAKVLAPSMLFCGGFSLALHSRTSAVR